LLEGVGGGRRRAHEVLIRDLLRNGINGDEPEIGADGNFGSRLLGSGGDRLCHGRRRGVSVEDSDGEDGGRTGRRDDADPASGDADGPSPP